MARAPQRVTRVMALEAGAPPAWADRAPSNARKPSDVIDTTSEIKPTEVTLAATKGSPVHRWHPTRRRAASQLDLFGGVLCGESFRSFR